MPLLAHHHLIACIKAAAATTALITMSAISMAVGFLFGFRFRIVITPLLYLNYIILLAVCQHFFAKKTQKIEFFCKILTSNYNENIIELSINRRFQI